MHMGQFLPCWARKEPRLVQFGYTEYVNINKKEQMFLVFSWLWVWSAILLNRDQFNGTMHLFNVQLNLAFCNLDFSFLSRFPVHFLMCSRPLPF